VRPGHQLARLRRVRAVPDCQRPLRVELLEPRPRLAPPLRENLGVDLNLYTVLIVLAIIALIIWIIRSL
jgi:hypothetical protein